MFDFTEIRTGIVEWILSVTAKKGIMADQNSVKPADTHFIYRLNSIMQVGEDYLSEPNSSGLASLHGHRDFTCQILGFGSGVLALTETLRSSLQIPAILDALRVRKIVTFDRGPVEDITGLDETQYEERSSLDVFMRSQMVLTSVNVGAIEIFNGVATYKNQGSADITRNLTVSTI